jgi:adenylate cyclase
LEIRTTHSQQSELILKYLFLVAWLILALVYSWVQSKYCISISFLRKKVLPKRYCIKCFFAMKEDLRKRADWYNKDFGLLPTFKAGLHFGKVTTGEIGALKKEIIFTGDVLNSTARIQGLCNRYKVDLLISNDLIKNLDLGSEFQIKSLGKIELRGKMENIELCTIL